MPVLRRKEMLAEYVRKQSTVLSESAERAHARSTLSRLAKSASSAETFDIFLSHAFNDARVVLVIKELIEETGKSVYVDWIEDDHLERDKVTDKTARVLRMRMNQCGSLIYLTSQSAAKSLWMPWELGYMDARTGRVAVAPILEQDETFHGREYLGLYPYLDRTSGHFYMQRTNGNWVTFREWMAGSDPNP